MIDTPYKTNLSTTIKLDVHKLAKENNISWNVALEFGVLFLLADKDGGLSYDYPLCNLKGKLDRTVETIRILTADNQEDNKDEEKEELAE